MTSTVNNTPLVDELEGRRKKGDAQEIRRNIIKKSVDPEKQTAKTLQN